MASIMLLMFIVLKTISALAMQFVDILHPHLSQDQEFRAKCNKLQFTMLLSIQYTADFYELIDLMAHIASF